MSTKKEIKIIVLGGVGSGKSTIASIIHNLFICDPGITVTYIDDTALITDQSEMDLKYDTLIKSGLSITVETQQVKSEGYSNYPADVKIIDSVEELTPERKSSLSECFDATVNKMFEEWQKKPENKDIKVSSSTIHDPIQLKILAMAIDHTKTFDEG